MAHASLEEAEVPRLLNPCYIAVKREIVMLWKQFITPVKSLDANAAKAFMDEHKEGSFTLLDVRQPGEYEKARIPGAKLIPLPELSDRLGELDPEGPVIVY
jgi:hypothetical protein